ncbi:lipopolysaccharide biosynthesis protein [Methylobacter psychrophilus]|uniref:lipopolysaccharide biosynthesis protein n=1 Tax=Methylobacter psychrophilus TaxID=96941 RepID=UPI0021D50AE1|nr:lipopolysaccharide biosynthesis protein [Methylobacter psychrophilus]
MKERIFSATLWSGADIFMRQGLQFFVSIILARLLSPEEFGLLAMLSLFTGIAGLFIDSGFSSALIQRQDITSKDESTVFFFNLGTGLFVALGLCLAAPWIDRFFEQPILQDKTFVTTLNLYTVPWLASFFELPVLQSLTYVMAFNLLLGSFASIQGVLLTKVLNFKALMKIGVVASLLSGVLAVALAWKGFGIWSLALQSLASTLITVVLLWLWHPWRPQWVFSLASLRSLFRFGGFMLLSGLLDTLYTRIYSIIIGKLFSAQELGFYTRADNTQQLPVNVLTNVLHRVAFPIFSADAADKVQLARRMRKALRTIMLLNIPAMLGMMVVAEPLVITLIGEKWLPSVPILQVLCLGGVIWPLHVLNLNVLMAQGYSNLFLRIEIVKKVIGIIAIVVASFYGILAIAWSQVVVGVLCFLINAHYTKVFLDYSAWKQTRDLLPYLTVSILMTLVIWPIHIYLTLHPSAELGLMIGAGALFYLLACRLFRLEAFNELWTILILRGKPVQNLYVKDL